MRTLVALVALLLAAPPAFAFDILDSYWSRSDFPLSYNLDTDGFEPGRDATQAAVAAAFDAWADVDCAPAVSFDSTSSSSADLRLWRATSDWSPPPGSGVLAYASRPGGYGAIRFNGIDVEWTVDGEEDVGEADLQGVAVHEIGHTLGIDHSRVFDATMFFSGSNVRLRSLEPDDERAVCYLYGTVQSGEVCDYCEAHDECGGSDDSCINFGTGDAFCGAQCTRDSQCPDTYFCAELEGDAQSCVPENLVCDQSPSDFPIGDYCYGDINCASNMCVAIGEQAYCSEECNPSSSSSCPGGFTCIGESGDALCYPVGEGAVGESCDSHPDCESFICVLVSEDEGTCTQECDPAGDDCPPGSTCLGDDEDDGLCFATGDGTFGEPCEANLDCEAAACVGIAEDDYRCSLVCEDASDCPLGAPCWDFGSEDYCAPAAGCNPWTGLGCAGDQVCYLYTADSGLCVDYLDGLDEGERCLASAQDCNNTLICTTVEGDRTPSCVDVCNVDTGQGCPEGIHCNDQAGFIDPIGACPRPTGTGWLGDACRNFNSCASGWCVDDDLGTYCTLVCEQDEDCPASVDCEDGDNGQRYCKSGLGDFTGFDAPIGDDDDVSDDDDDDGGSDDDDTKEECECDDTWGCDEGCEHCDPECLAEEDSTCGCSAADGADVPAALILLACLARRRGLRWA